MSKGLSELDGKVAVITGAASGIGRALAMGLWNKGCHLALIDLNDERLSQLRSELTETGKDRRVSVHTTDVADKTRMKETSTDIVDAHQAVHLLINNAGIGYEAPFPQMAALRAFPQNISFTPNGKARRMRWGAQYCRRTWGRR